MKHLTETDIINRANKERINEVKYLEGYIDMLKHCWWLCLKCSHKWLSTPNNILNKKRRCPNCAKKSRKEKLTNSIDFVIEKINKKHNHNILYVSGYTNMLSNCLWKCMKCGHQWLATPHNVSRGTSCPVCTMNSMEKPIIDILDKKNVKYIHNKGLKGCIYNKKTLRPDFIIKKLVIECDGQQHFLPTHGVQFLREQQEKDLYKNKFLKKHGYILIRVTSSSTKEWGTEKHLTLKELLELLDIGIDENGNVNMNVFIPHDFNR